MSILKGIRSIGEGMCSIIDSCVRPTSGYVKEVEEAIRLNKREVDEIMQQSVQDRIALRKDAEAIGSDFRKVLSQDAFSKKHLDKEVNRVKDKYKL